MRDYDATVKNLREAAKGLLFDAMPYRASVMRDAADAIEELMAKVPTWISVEERLPEFQMNGCGCVCTDTILFGTEDKTVHLGYAIRTATNVKTTDGHELVIMDQWYDQRGERIEDVDRWCPLPEPPKEVLPNGEV